MKKFCLLALLLVSITAQAQNAYIMFQPKADTTCSNTPLVFDVVTNTLCNFQWQKNGVNIPNATTFNSQTSELRFNNAQLSDSGNYRVVITHGNTTIISNTVVGVVEDAPVIISSPVAANACMADTLTVVATGTHLNYLWKRYNSTVQGATGPQLIINNNTASSKYSCTVSNSCATVTTPQVEIKISEPIWLCAEQGPVTICEGQNTLFAQGGQGGYVMYEWIKDGVVVQTSDANFYNVNNATQAHAGMYTCHISNACGAIVSHPFIFTVTPINVTITTQPQSMVVCPGEPINLFIEASGAFTHYQWKHYNNNVGINSPFLSIPNAQASDAGVYTCAVASLSCGNVYSWGASVDVSDSIVVTDLVINETGNTISLIAVTNNTGLINNLSFTWLFNGAVITTTTDPNITIDKPTIGGVFEVQVTGGCGNTPATATYAYLPTGITTHSVNAAIKLFPNPAANYLTIASPQNYGNANISIYSALGALVYNKNLSLLGNQTIMLDGLTNGLYTVIINGNKGDILTKEKLVVVR